MFVNHEMSLLVGDLGVGILDVNKKKKKEVKLYVLL